MPIPTPESGQTEREYISACISEIYPEYDVEGQAYAICQSTWDRETLSKEDFWSWDSCMEKMLDEYEGDEEIATKVCGMIKYRQSEEFGKVEKFVYPPKNKENMTSYMSRCMSNDLVRKKYKNRQDRARFCFGEFQNRYINSIGKNWK